MTRAAPSLRGPASTRPCRSPATRWPTCTTRRQLGAHPAARDVLPVPADAPSAVAVAGRRTAPPEDSGGGADLASIAMVVDDPTHFDLIQLNKGLRAPYFMLLFSTAFTRGWSIW